MQIPRLLSAAASFRSAAVCAACAVALTALPASAQTTYYWVGPTGTFNTGTTGTWSSTDAWRTGSSTGTLATYANASDATAIIGGTSTTNYTITLSGSLQVNTIRLDASTGSGKRVIIDNSNQPLVFGGSASTVSAGPGRALQFSTGNTGTYSIGANATLTFDGGGTIDMRGRLRPSGTNATILVTNTTFLNFGFTSGGYQDGSGTAARPNTVIVNSGTLQFQNGIFLAPITLGTSGAGGGTLQLRNNTISSDMRSTLTVGGTSMSRVNQDAGTYSFLSGSSAATNFQVTVNSTGDPSGVDLDYSVGWRRGTFEKLGAGTLRMATTGTFNNTTDFATYVNTGTALRVTAGTFISEGTVKSIANVGGGLLTTTSTAGSFDQVNVTSGTFEVARSSGLFNTLSGTTYAAGNSALNLRGGTLRYVGVNTDYSERMGQLGGAGSTVDSNGQTVTFATGLSGTGGLRKVGAGTLILDGVNTFTGTTGVNVGELRLNGSVSGNVAVAAGAILGGSGQFAGLSGDGLVAPGSSPGILTGTASLDPSGGLDFAFEVGGAVPLWSDATASVNDVLRITDLSTPFTTALGAGNTVSVYLDVATLTGGDEFLGGFFTDRTTGLLSDVQGGNWVFYVSGTGGGPVSYNGLNYYALNDWIASPQNTAGVTGINVGVTTVPTADFAGGDLTNGQVTTFVVIAVPEPATAALAGIGLAAAAWAVRRRSSAKRPDRRRPAAAT